MWVVLMQQVVCAPHHINNCIRITHTDPCNNCCRSGERSCAHNAIKWQIYTTSQSAPHSNPAA